MLQKVCLIFPKRTAETSSMLTALQEKNLIKVFWIIFLKEHLFSNSLSPLIVINIFIWRNNKMLPTPVIESNQCFRLHSYTDWLTHWRHRRVQRLPQGLQNAGIEPPVLSLEEHCFNH